MLLPLGWGLYFNEGTALAFGIPAGAMLLGGAILWKLIQPTERRLSRRESLLLVVLTWVLASLFGALPYLLSGALPTYLDSFFEAMSGFSSAGASVFVSVENVPQSILLWRSFTQWLGGMGIVMLFVALFPILGIGAAYLAEAEAPSGQGEQVTARVRDTARAIWLIYLMLSIVELVLLLVAGLEVFDALTVTFSTLPGGGFAPHDLSIGYYDNFLVELIVIIFMIAGSVNFSLYYLFFWRHQPGRLFKNPEFVLYITIMLVSTGLISLNLIQNTGLAPIEAIRQAGFHVVSAESTTGFATADFNTWPDLSRFILLALMIIGGSAGSTSGALKVVRLIISAKYIRRRVIHSFNPQAIIPLKIGDNVVPEGFIARSIGLVIVYIASIIIGTLIMTGLGLDAISGLSSVIACLGTVGPGLGMVGPMSNYFAVPALGKIVLIFCMLAGRLEFFTLLAIFSPSFWRWR
jgi:trk system potassium uptake protein TrkH